MNSGRYDVVIIGAGAAGCAAALSLPPGTRALLVDRGDPARGRCCGGLLAGEAAGLVSPSSGEGLSFALSSGAAAGSAAASANPQAAYARAFGRQAARVARKFIKARVIFSPRLRRLALRLPWCP